MLIDDADEAGLQQALKHLPPSALVTSQSLKEKELREYVAAAESDGSVGGEVEVYDGADSESVPINYPTGFIARDATAWAARLSPVELIPLLSWRNMLMSLQTTSLKIKVMTGQTVSAGTEVLITLQGRTLGAATAGSATRITVSAPGNAESTTAVAAQEIAGAVSNVRFLVSAAPLRAVQRFCHHHFPNSNSLDPRSRHNYN